MCEGVILILCVGSLSLNHPINNVTIAALVKKKPGMVKDLGAKLSHIVLIKSKTKPMTIAEIPLRFDVARTLINCCSESDIIIKHNPHQYSPNNI